MRSELHSALRSNPAGVRLLALRRSVLDASAPVRNRVLGCRVKSRGAGNSVACFRVRRLSKTSITILGDGNSVTFSHEARIESCTIVIRGNGNRVVIGRSLLTGVGVAISGDGNTISVGDACMIMGLSLVCEDDANSIVIAASTQVHGSTELAAIEGTRIRIGESCLFSGGIHFRTGDSHSLTDLEGKRTNPSRDITIGDHVWLGMNVTVLKGVTVPDSSVVGACSVVSGRFGKPHCVIAGNPARVLREGIDWRVDR